ncbi:MAG: hypothetical protein ACYSTX_03960 [Planctomycetota bacterium]|jgi:hypothetical protein
MQRIFVKDKSRIRELLYDGYILGIKDDKFAAGGIERWMFDKQIGKCQSCAAFWSDRKKKVRTYKLDKAAKILWHHRKSLYIYTKKLTETERFLIRDCLEGV